VRVSIDTFKLFVCPLKLLNCLCTCGSVVYVITDMANQSEGTSENLQLVVCGLGSPIGIHSTVSRYAIVLHMHAGYRKLIMYKGRTLHVFRRKAARIGQGS